MANYYIAKTGDDGSDGSLTTPWETITKANTTLTAGDTVFIRTGTYSEQLFPNNSGTSGNYITYQNYQEEVVTLTRSAPMASLVGRSYINIDGIRFIDATGSFDQGIWITLHSNNSNHAHHNIIQNNHFEQTVQQNNGAYAGIGITNSNYNTIKNNYFKGKPGNPVGDHIIIQPTSRYNLIENNTFWHVQHQCVNLSGDPVEYNIIRNNFISNPLHTSISLWLYSNHNLISNNLIYDSGEEHLDNIYASSQARDKHKGLQIGASYCIIRQNTFVNNGANTVVYADSVRRTEFLRFYNNTIYNEYRAIQFTPLEDNVPEDCIFKNNIIQDSVIYNLFVHGDCSGMFFDHNDILGSAVTFACTDNYTNNLAIDPVFVDTELRDFELDSESPLINAGDFLTTTNGTGSSSTTLIVDDSRYFIDGWGIVTGDTIQLEGQETTAIITNITDNTLTIDTALTWTNGLGVSLPFSGTTPDMGSNEFDADAGEGFPEGTTLIEAESGTLVAPMAEVVDGTASGGKYIKTTVTNDGTASFNFHISNAGNYIIRAGAFCADFSSNSFLVQVDSETNNIWDIYQTEQEKFGSWDIDIINDRGAGSADIPEHDPYIIHLNVGNHTIVFSGRETDSRLDYFIFVLVNDDGSDVGVGVGVLRGVFTGVI